MKKMIRGFVLILVSLAPALASAALGDAIFISSWRIGKMKERVQNKIAPNYQAYQVMMTYVNASLGYVPQAPSTWYVPRRYADPEGHQRAKASLMNDANTSYKMALAYRITGQSKYADVAVKIIKAWYTKTLAFRTEDDSQLSFSYHFPAMIYAADLIKGYAGFTATSQSAFKSWIRSKALAMGTGIINRDNNWGNWGLLMVTSSAAYLKDSTLFQKCVTRYKEFIASQIGTQGEMIEEVTRNNGVGDYGIVYSHFSLLPTTLTAQIIKVNGVDLFEYKSGNNRTLKMAFDRIARWSRHPDEFPYFEGDLAKLLNPAPNRCYFEILNLHWPNGNAAYLLGQSRPLDVIYSAPVMTLTNGGF